MLGGEPQRSAAQEVLSWAADAEGGAPYIFKDPNKPTRHLGFEVDIANALAQELGCRIEFKQYEFESLLAGVERGDFDFAMNGLEITEANKQRVHFSRPYYVYKLQLVARVAEDRFHSLDECSGRKDLKIGTLSNSAGERALRKRGIAPQTYTDQVGPYTDLTLGRLDAVLLDWPIARYFASPDFKQPFVQTFPGLKFVGEPTDEGLYAIAVSKDAKGEALAARIDVALDRLLRTGELERIYDKWGIQTGDQYRLRVTAGKEEAASESSTEEWTFRKYFALLVQGAEVTVFITLVSMLLAILLGMPIALARLYGPAPLRWLATLYVEFFRGIPVLLLLYFLYYGLPSLPAPFGVKLGPLQAAILGFGLNYAAFEAEIYRAGISSIPAGQWEAGASLGMSSWLTFRRIIFPQTIRVILPPMTNDLVGLFKDTSVVSIIAVQELSKWYQMITKSGGSYAEVGLVTAALYLIMSVPLGHLSRYLEKHGDRTRDAGNQNSCQAL